MDYFVNEKYYCHRTNGVAYRITLIVIWQASKTGRFAGEKYYCHCTNRMALWNTLIVIFICHMVSFHHELPFGEHLRQIILHMKSIFVIAQTGKLIG